MQNVVPAGNAQDLHCESARGPNPPDLLWFHCLKSARLGGETTFADGMEIWNQLSASTRALFLSKRVNFVELLPSGAVARRLAPVFFAELEHLNLGGTTFRFQEDGSLRMEFVTCAVHRYRGGPTPKPSPTVSPGRIPAPPPSKTARRFRHR